LIFFLPVLAGPVLALVTYPNCTVVGYEWSYNSLNQNPCDVSATLESVCYGGQYTIPPLSYPQTYSGPYVNQDNMCECNNVVYSLTSACGGCQGSSWISWAQWSLNCSSKAPPSTYPFTIPQGTRVPHWAYLDVTRTGNWDATAAQGAGDSPEATPSPTASSSSKPSPTSGSPAPASSSSNPNRSHAGKIAGVVAGAVVGVSLLIGIVFWYLQRQFSHIEVEDGTSTGNKPPVTAQPIPSLVSSPRTETPTTPPSGHPAYTGSIGGVYDPSDPDTYPTLVLPPSMPT